MKLIGSVAKTAFHYKKIQGFYPNWKLHYKFKCLSSEYELTNWLKNYQIQKHQPIAVIVKEQLSGFGQNSRNWHSPLGGIWLSAAYPIFSEKFVSEIFSLSIAIKLCEMLNSESIKVDLKWPNDIYFDSKKLIGFLPRVVTRGKETIYVRVGLGMNFLNKTPIEGISLSEILHSKQISEYYWTAKVLKAIHESISCNGSKEYIIKKANNYLSKGYLPRGYESKDWRIKEIDSNGNLKIFNGIHEKILKRF